MRGDIESLSLSLRIEGVFGCDMVASGEDEMELREDGGMRGRSCEASSFVIVGYAQSIKRDVQRFAGDMRYQ